MPSICVTCVLTVFHKSKTTISASLAHAYEDVIANTTDEAGGIWSSDDDDDGRNVVIDLTDNGSGVFWIVTVFVFFASNDKDDEDDNDDDDDDDDEDEDDEFCFLISQYKSGRTLIIIDPDLIYGDCSRVSTDILIVWTHTYYQLMNNFEQTIWQQTWLISMSLDSKK